MKTAFFSIFQPVATAILLAVTTVSVFAAASLTQQVDPPAAYVGDEIAITYTIQNGSGISIHLPAVDGLQVLGTRSSTNITFNNGVFSSAYSESIHVIPTRPGDYTIPAFDIHLQDGGLLRTQPIKLHVNAAPGAPAPATSPAPANPPSTPAFNPNGPVVMPPANDTPPATPPPTPASGDINPATNSPVPTESDGRPAKVFVVITPQTSDAYVGQSIPMRIDWYIRMDVDAQQDSLPTIKGSDFLMNNLSTRPREDTLAIMNEPYRRDSWLTAISAPKPGDFPLQMERDTYWIKSSNPTRLDPFSRFFPGRPNLAHQAIESNQLTVHIHDLPTEGRPANFTGAIGQFTVTGIAQPLTVAVGEPVTLRYTVNGQGNFDYVRCPTLVEDPAWKTYVPSSKINYQEETRTQGVKTFEMAIIPRKNGTIPLPKSSFSYFDPATKQYVTNPVSLPDITVTGSATAAVTTPGAMPDTSPASTTAADEFRPNRLTPGWSHTSLKPIYHQAWFWIVQGVLFAAFILSAVMLYIRSRPKPDDGRAEKLQRQQSLALESDAMAVAVQQGDSLAFFMAARHAIQLQLGARWRMNPESITLSEIRQRDPQLAESLEPLFVQADEIIYSGGTGKGLDLAQWERHVRELLQGQPA